MPDILRTALKGGGAVDVQIRMEYNGDATIFAHEDYARLDARRSKTITAAELDAAEDPDALIHDTAMAMMHDCHTCLPQ